MNLFKCLLFGSIFFTNCLPSKKILIYPTVDIKLIQSWKCEEHPSCTVSYSKNKGIVFHKGKDGYWEYTLGAKELTRSTIGAELWGVTKKEDKLLFLTYNNSTRENEAWLDARIDGQEKVKMNIPDPENVVYSASTRKLYWTTTSKKIMLYDSVTKLSHPVWEAYDVAECLISENGNYLALRDTNNIFFVLDLVTNKVILSKKREQEDNYDLVGVTNDGGLVLRTMYTSRKNERNNPSKNKILCIKKEKEMLLMEGEIDWAQITGQNLMLWNDGTLSMYTVDL